MAADFFTRSGYALPGTSVEFKTGSWRTQKPSHKHILAPCHNQCPAGEDPQAYIAKVAEGHAQQAWEMLVSANPLPAITGRVCPHPCEKACNRGEYDEAIAIHSIERFLGDEAIANNWPYPVNKPPVDAPRVAVVGAGPAGLSAAYHLIRLGYQVTLFTALGEPGGTIYTIPGYRLPRNIIETETQRVLDVGIDFKPNHRLGRDMYLDELKHEYAAVFLAVGSQQSREWSVGGVTPRDLHVGLNVLKEWMAVGSVPEASSVAVVGGGNTAVDVARILKRGGVPEVYIITHNSLPGTDFPAYNMMRAIPREIEQAQEEGIKILPHRGIRRLILRGEQVVGVEMVHMKKIRDDNGRLKRVAFEGTETVLHVDQVIPAIGQVVNPAGLESLLNGKSYVPTDHWGQIPGQPALYAGGDMCESGQGTVTAAVGDGRRAADAIHRQLTNQPMVESTEVESIKLTDLNLNYYETTLISSSKRDQ